jgi:hypothetical protein
MLSDPSMRLMALEGIERILAIGETKISRSCRRDSLSNPNPYASLVSVEAVENLYSITKTTSLGKRVMKLYRDHFTACTICQKLFHKNTTVLKVCEECRGPVCLNCDCSIYHLSYQEEVWDLIESMEEEAKRAQKKKKKQKAKSNKVKKPTKGVEKPISEGDPKRPAEEMKAAPLGQQTLVPDPTPSPTHESIEIIPPKVSEFKAEPEPVGSVPRVAVSAKLATPSPNPGAEAPVAPGDSSDESFIAVSRHKRKNDRDKDKDKQDRDRKGKAPPPVARKPPPQPKPPPPSTSAPRPTPPTSRADKTPTPLQETRISNLTIARYADAVLQQPAGASSTTKPQTRPPDSLSSVAPATEFPPLTSLNQSLARRGEKKSPLPDSPSASIPAPITPSAYSMNLFQSDASPHYPPSQPLSLQRPLAPPSDSSPLSRLLAPPPSFDFSNPSSSARHALSDLFSPGLLDHSPAPGGDALSHTISPTSTFFSPPLPRTLSASDGSLFSPTGLAGDVDIEDGDLHMRRAEMLLTDDDDDTELLNTSRETEDLVEFLQETGSIAALAERLGFRK